MEASKGIREGLAKGASSPSPPPHPDLRMWDVAAPLLSGTDRAETDARQADGEGGCGMNMLCGAAGAVAADEGRRRGTGFVEMEGRRGGKPSPHPGHAFFEIEGLKPQVGRSLNIAREAGGGGTFARDSITERRRERRMNIAGWLSDLMNACEVWMLTVRPCWQDARENRVTAVDGAGTQGDGRQYERSM